MTLAITGCDLWTSDGHVTSQTLLISDGRIDAIGTDLAIPAGAEVIDGTGLIALPGLINTHTHAALSLLRGAVEDVSVDAWFNEYVWPIEVNVTADDVYLGTLLAAAEMIAAGVTTFADHYFHMDRAAAAVEESGIRADLGQCYFSSQGDDGLDASVAFANTWHGGAAGRITTSVAPHAPYTCSDQHLAAAAEAARELGVRVHLHAAEHIEQTESSLERRGVTPIQVLEDTGILDAGAIIAHGCGITASDVEILGRYAGRVGVSHCPKVYLKHGLQPLTPIPALLDAGVAIGMGTDGPAGCNSIDIFESMRLMALTQKHATRDATWMTTRHALELATAGGAAVLGRSDLGRLDVGAVADIILVDLTGPHCQPLHDPAAALVYAAGSRDVHSTIVDGRPLMVNRVMRTIDVADVVRRVGERAAALVALRDAGQSIQHYDP